MFEIVFLGTAAAVPSAERGSPALLVCRGPARFLVDCGEGTQRQLMRARLGFRGLEHVLLTHLHLDHVAGLAGLLATRQLYQLSGAIEIIGSSETVLFASRYLAATVDSECEAGYRLRAVAPGPVFSRPGWHLAAFPVAHRGTESLGYLFEEEAPDRFCPSASMRSAFRKDRNAPRWRTAARSCSPTGTASRPRWFTGPSFAASSSLW
jgi:ribonuclease Z